MCAAACRVLLLLALASGCAHAGSGDTTRAPAPPTPAPRRFVSPHSYEHFLRAELAFARGEYAVAVEAYRSALTDEDDPVVLARLAEALEKSGDREAADEALADGLELDADSEAVWLARGAIARGRGNVAGALAAYTQAQESAPDSLTAPLALAELLVDIGQRERAHAVLAQFGARVEGEPRAVARVALERSLDGVDGDAIASAVRAWLRIGPVDAATLGRAARSLVRVRRHALALRLVAAQPEHARDVRLLFDALVATARFDEAAELVAHLPPDALGSTLDIAEAYLAIDRPLDARAALDQVTARDEPRARLVHGESALLRSQWAEAARTLASIPTAARQHTRAIANLAHALRAQGLDALAAEVATGPDQ